MIIINAEAILSGRIFYSVTFFILGFLLCGSHFVFKEQDKVNFYKEICNKKGFSDYEMSAIDKKKITIICEV